MKILLLHPQNDPVCVGWNLYKALKKYTDHDVRYVVGIPTYLVSDVPMVEGGDLIVGHPAHRNVSKEQLRVLINDADVLHFSQWDWDAVVTNTDFTFSSLMTRDDQRIIYQGHGGAWLLDPVKQMQRCDKKNAVMVTCSPLDEVVVSDIKWMPNLLGLDEYNYTPNWERSFAGVLRVSLANKFPLYKGGEIVSYVFEYLRRFGYDVDFKIIRALQKQEALDVRKNDHFTVDNWTQGFFGMAGFEGLALGHVVIARVDEVACKNWDKEFGGLPPVRNVHGMDECAKVVRGYYNNRALLEEHCKKSRQWIDDNYTDKAIAERWVRLYETG